LIDGAMQRIEEPGQPLGDIHRPLLGPLQSIVVGLALPLDLRRQAVEALRAAIGARQQRVAGGLQPVALREAVLDRAPMLSNSTPKTMPGTRPCRQGTGSGGRRRGDGCHPERPDSTQGSRRPERRQFSAGHQPLRRHHARRDAVRSDFGADTTRGTFTFVKEFASPTFRPSRRFSSASKQMRAGMGFGATRRFPPRRMRGNQLGVPLMGKAFRFCTHSVALLW
jgi:hypothetical protein